MWFRDRGVAAGLAAALVAMATVQVLGTPARADTLRIETREGVRKVLFFPTRYQPAATVIMLHGAIRSGKWAARRFGFREAAAAYGFAAAFPRSTGGRWQDGRGRAASRADDVAFMRRLVAELVEEGVADPRRVYIAGVSNGGMMALRMVCEAAELFAGAGTVIASMPAAIGPTCNPSRPVPVVMLNGSADRWVPYRGGRVGLFNLGGPVWGVERTAAFLAEANGCRRGPVVADARFGRLSLTRLAWRRCAGKGGVTLYRVNGGGHQVLGRNRIFSSRKDKLSAAEMILARFAADLRPAVN